MANDDAEARPAAIGLRVKSGWASVVLLGGAGAEVGVEDRRTIDLSDPDVPESRQPFHPALGLPEEEAQRVTAPLLEIVERCASRSLTELVAECRASGHDLVGAGLVVGSDADPARIANQHIRAHALEGRLFKEVLERSLGSQMLDCLVVLERDAYVEAGRVLQRSERELRHAVTRLGRAFGAPWRADEKTAALAAWVVLARSEAAPPRAQTGSA